MNLAARAGVSFGDRGRRTEIATPAAPLVVLAAVDINAVIDEDS